MTQDTQHTPGPWTAIGCSIMAGPSSTPIRIAHTVSCSSGLSEELNNARLIAEAPALLAALKTRFADMAEPIHEHSSYYAEYEHIRALIARAEGR